MKLIIFITLLVLLGVLSVVFDLPQQVAEWVVVVNTWGFIGILVFVLLYAGTTALMVPGSLLTIAAGFIFGFTRGLAVTIIAANIGATLAFFIGRYVAREWASRMAQRYSFFRSLDDTIAREGWKMVALLRLSPIVPFNLINYILGLTSVSPLTYISASLVCMLPGTAAFVYLGSLAGSLTEAISGQREYTPIQWALLILGLLATFVMSIWIARIARRTLQKKISSQDAPKT